MILLIFLKAQQYFNSLLISRKALRCPLVGVAAPKLLVYYAYKVLRHPILRAEAPGLLSNFIFLCSKPSQSIKDPFFSGSCVSPQRLYHFQTSSMIRNPPGFPLFIFFNNVDLKYSPMEIPFVLPILSHSNNG